MTDRAQDVRDVLGMRTTGGWLIGAFYSATYLVIALTNTAGVRHVWVVVAAALLVSAGPIGLITGPGDPLPLRYSIPLAALGPVSTALVLSQLPVPIANALQTWPLGAATAILVFLCVRGQTIVAWIGMVTMIGVCVLWTIDTGQGAGTGVAMSILNLAPLLMATFFAYTVRPTIRSIFVLRGQSTARAASEAAAAATLEERDAQLDRLDLLARPILQRIADGERLTAKEQDTCRLLESHLRDTLRAAGLVDAAVSSAARAARIRGVTVVLLDDGALRDCPEEVIATVRRAVIEALDSADAGTLTARVLPPGRDKLATILVSSEVQDRRVEIDPDGSINTETEAAI